MTQLGVNRCANLGVEARLNDLEQNLLRIIDLLENRSIWKTVTDLVSQ